MKNKKSPKKKRGGRTGSQKHFPNSKFKKGEHAETKTGATLQKEFLQENANGEMDGGQQEETKNHGRSPHG